MTQQFETIQKAGKDQVEATVKSFGVVSKGIQAVATESTDFAKKSFEQGTAAFEKLSAAKTVEKAIEIQTDFAKTYFEAATAQASKFAELYTAMFKDAAKPFEGIVGKMVPAAK